MKSLPAAPPSREKKTSKRGRYGAALRRLRGSLGITQAIFAELLGVHLITIARIESGVPASDRMRARLAPLLDDLRRERDRDTAADLSVLAGGKT